MARPTGILIDGACDSHHSAAEMEPLYYSWVIRGASGNGRKDHKPLPLLQDARTLLVREGRTPELWRLDP